jgi:hypothetical protein
VRRRLEVIGEVEAIRGGLELVRCRLEFVRVGVGLVSVRVGLVRIRLGAADGIIAVVSEASRCSSPVACV